MSEKLNTKVEKNQKTTIEMIDHVAFKGDMKTNIISSVDMADLISSLFAPVFSDYYGCKIRINDGTALPYVNTFMPLGSVYVDIFFKDQGNAVDGSIKNISLLGSNKEGGSDLGARYHRVNGAFRVGRAYEVSKETYEAIEEFMRPGTRTRWNECTQEKTTQMSIYGKEEVVVCISGLDINKLVTKIYGFKNEDARYEYIATPSTIIPTSQSQEFIIQVSQLDLSAVRKLQNTLGIYGANAPMFHQYRR